MKLEFLYQKVKVVSFEIESINFCNISDFLKRKFQFSWILNIVSQKFVIIYIWRKLLYNKRKVFFVNVAHTISQKSVFINKYHLIKTLTTSKSSDRIIYWRISYGTPGSGIIASSKGWKIHRITIISLILFITNRFCILNCIYSIGYRRHRWMKKPWDFVFIGW